MNATEADELYQLVLDLFKPLATPERAFRLRARFIESNALPNTIRELVFQHRETHEFLTESALLAELAKACGKPSVDPAKQAIVTTIEKRRQEKKAWESGVESDRHRLDLLAAMPEQDLMDLRRRALEKIKSESIRKRLTAVEHPLQSPTLAGLMMLESGMIGWD